LRRAILCLMLIWISGAQGQILSIHPPEDPLLILLGRERESHLCLESWQPWGFSAARLGELKVQFQPGPMLIVARVGWQSWGTLQVQTGDVFLTAPIPGMEAGLRFRAELLEGRLFHALDGLLAMRGRTGIALRIRINEHAEPGVSARSTTEAIGLSMAFGNFHASWMRGGSEQRPVEDSYHLEWNRESWEGAWTHGPGPVQELELAWRGSRRFAALRFRWHPYLGIGRGLILGVKL
jgi:hypothetical protein